MSTFVLSDRVKESSLTEGDVGYVVLHDTFGSFQSFAQGIGDGNTTYYTIENNVDFEVGIGTYDLATNTLTRDVILDSSNSGQRITLNGVSIVFCTYPAAKASFVDEAGYITAQSPYLGIKFPDGTIQTTAGGGGDGECCPKTTITLNSASTLSQVYDFVFLDAISSFDVYLPAASGISGTSMTFKRRKDQSSNNYSITLKPKLNTLETVDGENEISILFSKESISVVSDGQDWQLF